MALTVGSVGQLWQVPSSTSGDSPSGGGDVVAARDASGDSPQAGGSPVAARDVSADSPQAGGAPTAVLETTADSPQAGGGPTAAFVVAADSPQAGGTELEAGVGNVSGRPLDGSEAPAQGGVGAWVQGAAFGERENFEHRTTIPGLTLSGQDINTSGQERTQFTHRVDAEVEVHRQTYDFSAALPDQALYTPSGDAAFFIPTRLLLRAVDVQAVVTQPEIQLQESAPGDVLTQVPIGLTATGQATELDANAVRQAVANAATLTLGNPVAGAATAYLVEVVVLGRVIPA